MKRWRIRLFGGLSVERDGQVVLEMGTRKDDLLLIYVALSPTTTHVRETIACALWPGVESAKARKILSFNQYSLKKRLAAVGLVGVIVETRSTIRLAPGMATDVQEFTDLVRRAAAIPSADIVERARLLAQANALFGDGLLPSYGQAWLDGHRVRLEQLQQLAVTAAGAPGQPAHRDELGRGGIVGGRPALSVAVGPIGAEESDAGASSLGFAARSDELRRAAEQVLKWEEGLGSAEAWSVLDEVDQFYESSLRELLSQSPRRWTIEPMVSIAAGLWRYWYLKAQYAEGATSIDRLLSSGLPVAPRTRAKAIHGSGTLAYFNGDLQRAVHRLREALSLWNSIGDEEGLLRTLINLGMSQYGLQEYEQALSTYDQAIGIAARLGQKHLLSSALFNASLAALGLGNAQRVHDLLSRRLALGPRVLDDAARASTHLQLSTAALAEDDDAEALRQAELAWSLLMETLDHRGKAVALSLLGRCAQRARDFDRALELYETAVAEAKRSGDPVMRAEALSYLAVCHAARGEHVEADRVAEQARQLYRIAGAEELRRRFEQDLVRTGEEGRGSG